MIIIIMISSSNSSSSGSGSGNTMVVVDVGITACRDLCVFNVFQCVSKNAPRLHEVLVC